MCSRHVAKFREGGSTELKLAINKPGSQGTRILPRGHYLVPDMLVGSKVPMSDNNGATSRGRPGPGQYIYIYLGVRKGRQTRHQVQ